MELFGPSGDDGFENRSAPIGRQRFGATEQASGESDVVVMGSQAILGSYDESQPLDEAIASIEVGVTFFEDEGDTKCDKVDAESGALVVPGDEPVLRTRGERLDGDSPGGLEGTPGPLRESGIESHRIETLAMWVEARR